MNRFVRLHKAPKKCKRGFHGVDLSDPKSQYYYEESKKRYLKTKDGKYLDSACKGLLSGEIGRYEGVSFIKSELKDTNNEI